MMADIAAETRRC